jgi:hypothetical protein
MESRESAEPAERELTLVAAAGAGALLGAGGSDLASLILGAAGSQAAVGWASLIWDTHVRSRIERAAIPLGLAAKGLDEDVDVVAERVAADPDLTSVVADAMKIAADTTYIEKLRALGNCLRNALADRATLDLERLFVRTLADIEEPHVQILLILEDQARKSGSVILRKEFAVLTNGRFGAGIDPVIAVLTSSSLAMAKVQTIRGAKKIGSKKAGKKKTFEGWVVTDFGRALMERILEASEPSQSGRGGDFA